MVAPATLAAWADRHRIPAAALEDLLAVVVPPSSAPAAGHASEAYVQSLVRLEAPGCGVWLTRNNVGALQDKTGRPVRYGLANESKAQNEIVKSGDLIGIDSRPIRPEEVGRPRGRFVSRECKHADWRPGEDPAREAAQVAWMRLVLKYGGDAKIVRGEGSF